METFYDKLLPSDFGKIGKKWGAKVGTEKVVIGDERAAISIADALDRVKDGKPVWAQSQFGGGQEIITEKQLDDLLAQGDNQFYSLEPIAQDVPSIPITPEMRESVMQGQPLFKGGEDPRQLLFKALMRAQKGGQLKQCFNSFAGGLKVAQRR